MIHSLVLGWEITATLDSYVVFVIYDWMEIKNEITSPPPVSKVAARDRWKMRIVTDIVITKN